MRSRNLLIVVAVAIMIAWTNSARVAAAQGTTLPNEIIGSEWLLLSLQNSAGSQDTGGKNLSVQFNADGTVFGSSGCNTFRGGYTASSPQGVKFGELATTLIGCEEAVATLESDYLAALKEITTYSLDSLGLLKLSSADGQVVLTYGRPTPAGMPRTGEANDITVLLGIFGLLLCVAGLWLVRRRAGTFSSPN